MIIDILLVIIIFQVGLTSGLLFIFAFSVNPGLARLSEEEYFRAMKYINIVILNPIFFLVFMGTFITCLVATTKHLKFLWVGVKVGVKSEYK